MAKPEWMHQRLYQWVKPRSLGLHLAFIVVAGLCLWAGWWQVHRAMQGNALSYFYSIEWPAFAVVAGIGWWKMFHDTPEDIAARQAYHQRMRRASAAVVARTLPRSATALTVASEEVDGRVLGTGAGGAAAELMGENVGGGGGNLVRSGLTPERRRPTQIEGLLPDEDNDYEDGDAMTDYNRYLAALAVKGKPKTWRNPRGV